ncbi:YqaJ viral recombinase family protein [Paraburkholderia caballeronis]|uniref:Phage-related protein, predicted endonuclease n=1 Tax=Paraburkholderia caballeronis TaxID=416943 RepID=A0A1H7TXX9_9BURK|nr:YqaJ viral recombinase family protein [Paraburkholderia caballeronis]PXW23377.1 putative phage-related endonuclease [Paraburkholderia caballeronis]PXW98370.1 putative phage-related endonuclease [Paraburkholderia caballeronis]RAJ95100.1 putative phage-related endonuclease [Paraburkholderia caballeronis]SEC57149.1 Phage-related protein, predicted endonuclease [Paraburkholderia caballeronis]SEL89414.1 Phage-related protein, predicted endonuclease [Paraburkholderia caballeronis]
MIERITHDLVQGSPEWMEFRLKHFGASEAAAMLGLSTKVKRNELLHMKYTGTPKEFSDWVQEHILDKGHEVEALARPIVEEMLGEDLYPMVFSLGRMSASCDGLTMIEDTAWENKQFNQSLYASIENGVLPEEHMPQAQQVLFVTGAKRLIFTCSDGTESGTVWMEVLPDAMWFDRLCAGWAQFEKDLATYEPREIKEKPQAEAIMGLPTLAVQIKGEVVASNLPRFRAAAETFIANIKTDLQTDEDFANAEETVKFCEKAEKELEVAKNAAIAQTASIDDLMRTLDHIKAQLRDKRLGLDKLVKKRKDEIKTEIVQDGRKAYAAHVDALNAELGAVKLDIAAPDFITAAKNKRTLASLHEAIDTAVANGKIAADAAAKDLRAKLQWFAAHDEHAFLFRDLQTLIQKPADDFQLVVTSRIAEHKRQEAEKEDRRKAAEAAEAQRVAAAAEAAKQVQAEAPAVETSSKPAEESVAATLAPTARDGAKAASAPARRIPRPTAADILDVLAEHYGATLQQVAALLSTMDFKAELARFEATA